MRYLWAKQRVHETREFRLLENIIFIFIFCALLGAAGLLLLLRAAPLLLRIFGGALLTIALLSVSLTVYGIYQARPKEETALWEIELGTPQSEVKFLKGAPTEVVSDNEWRYSVKESDEVRAQYVVGFKDAKVIYVSYYATGFGGPSLQGVSVGAGSQGQVEDRFGEPAKTVRSADSLAKILEYPGYNLWVGLTVNRVDSLGIYDPKAWDPSFPTNRPAGYFSDRLKLDKAVPDNPKKPDSKPAADLPATAATASSVGTAAKKAAVPNPD